MIILFLGKTKAVKPTSAKCVDTGRYCADWTRKGECTRNPAYMKIGCRKSCGYCK